MTPSTPPPPRPRWSVAAAMTVILVAAALARLWNLSAGVPHAVEIDEPQIIDRALRILHTGEWNTHLFDYPTLVIYLQAAVAIVRFLWGALNGEWASLAGLSIGAVYLSGRSVAAAIGIATVWLVYRIGARLDDRRVGLLAAAALAVQPIHVRESRFILTDVPAASLTTATIWLAMRAARVRTARAYAWAGAAAGLAAAAKYTGGVAIVAVAAAWLVQERRSAARLRTALAGMFGAAAGFLLAAPYTVLDLPEFLNGFAAQFSRFAGRGPAPAWRLYLKHLSGGGWWVVAMAVAGIVVLMISRTRRRTALPAVAFTLAYFYILASHGHVLGRYAVPLIPMLCLFAAVTAVAAVDALRQRVPALARPAASGAVMTAAVLSLTLSSTMVSVTWLRQTRRPDTRTMAADFLVAHVPRGARVAVENSGPTYLDAAGFAVVPTEELQDHPVDFYRANADYLIVSSNPDAEAAYLAAGETVFAIDPGQRWGPPIRIVRLR